MTKWLRRIRGALGVGLTWAAAWAVVAPIAFMLLVGSFFGFHRVTIDLLLGIVGSFALAGFVGGAAFSALLSMVEGRRTFDEMSLPRFAGWGTLSGVLIYGSAAALFGGTWGFFLLAMFAVAGLLGAGSAAGSLALARMSDEGRLLEASAEVAAGGLTQEEARELLADPE